MTVTLMSVGAQSTDIGSQASAGQVFHSRPVKNQNACIVGHQLQIAQVIGRHQTEKAPVVKGCHLISQPDSLPIDTTIFVVLKSVFSDPDHCDGVTFLLQIVRANKRGSYPYNSVNPETAPSRGGLTRFLRCEVNSNPRSINIIPLV